MGQRQHRVFAVKRHSTMQQNALCLGGEGFFVFYLLQRRVKGLQLRQLLCREGCGKRSPERVSFPQATFWNMPLEGPGQRRGKRTEKRNGGFQTHPGPQAAASQ